MQIIIRAPSHPDVPRPPNDDLVALALRVCHAIEVCGASPELTKAVTLASDLHTYLQKPVRVAAHCDRPGGCVCGGDVPAVREGCSHWVK